MPRLNCMPPAPPLPVPARRLAPDLARGFMLLLIALANVSWYLWGHAPGPVGPHPAPENLADSIIQVLMLTFVDGRAFPLFSFLFAYGMVQFYTSRRARGLPDPVVRSMLHRRHAAMLVIGFLHALLLFAGDIVGAYALAGLVVGGLFFFRRTPIVKTWALVLAGLLLLFGLLALVGGIIVEAVGGQAAAVDATTSEVIDQTAGEPDYLVAMLWRVVTWASSALVSGILVPIPMLMMFGWLAARVRLLEDVATHRRTLVRIIAWTLPLGWVLGLVSGLQQVGVITFAQAPWMLIGLNQAAGIGAGIGYACLFALLAQRYEANPPRPVLAVAAVGQRSLSSYLWQSLIFAPLLSAWGFALGDDIGTWQAMLLATLVWLASVVICDQLGRSGRRGPAELALRRFTYGKFAAVAAGSGQPALSPAVPSARPGPPPVPAPHPGFRPPPGPGSA